MRKSAKLVIASTLAVAGALTYVLYPPEPRAIVFPDGKKFAFTIVDDTDMTALERSRPLYEVLNRHGLRTTKTVWVLQSTESSHSPNAGATLADPAYREFIVDLQKRGFEIALHGVRGGSSGRTDILTGLEAFRAHLGHYPRLHVNHSLNRDNVYWGADRWSFPPFRWAHQLMSEDPFAGQDPQSQYFWGDLLKAHVQYVNQFTFADINLLNITPAFPYRLRSKPYVNYWFPTADGDNLDAFEELLSSENLDRLEREGGVCLVYTHMGAGSFNRSGTVDPRFEARIRDVASRNGWFVPASELLDYLAQQPGWSAQPSFREQVRLETLFVWTVIRRSFRVRSKPARQPAVVEQAE